MFVDRIMSFMLHSFAARSLVVVRARGTIGLVVWNVKTRARSSDPAVVCVIEAQERFFRLRFTLGVDTKRKPKINSPFEINKNSLRSFLPSLALL